MCINCTTFDSAVPITLHAPRLCKRFQNFQQGAAMFVHKVFVDCAANVTAIMNVSRESTKGGNVIVDIGLQYVCVYTQTVCTGGIQCAEFKRYKCYYYITMDTLVNETTPFVFPSTFLALPLLFISKSSPSSFCSVSGPGHHRYRYCYPFQNWVSSLLATSHTWLG